MFNRHILQVNNNTLQATRIDRKNKAKATQIQINNSQTIRASINTRNNTEIVFWRRIGTPEYIINFLIADVLPPI